MFKVSSSLEAICKAFKGRSIRSVEQLYCLTLSNAISLYCTLNRNHCGTNPTQKGSTINATQIEQNKVTGTLWMCAIDKVCVFPFGRVKEGENAKEKNWKKEIKEEKWERSKK